VAQPTFGFTDDWALNPAMVAQARSAGAETVRVYASWADIEAVRGRYSWGTLDAVVQAAQAQGVRPLIVALGAPTWARIGGCTADGPPGACTYAPASSYDGDWSRFVRALASRYPNLLALEVWNEPNAAHFFAPTVDPARYTQLLKVAYRAAKSAAPGLPVISGGLSGIGASDRNGMADATFLDRMYRAGARAAMDAIGYHLYPGNHPLLVDLHAGLARVRRTRNANRDRRRRIWLTEFGLSTAIVPGREPVSEAEQAAALGTAYCDVSAMNDVPVMLVFRLRDTAGNDWLNRLGVLRADGSPKPSAPALRSLRANPACPTSRGVRITASTTSPARGQLVRFTALGHAGAYRWDLDGNGTYETSTNGSATVSTSWRRSGRRGIRVEVSDNLERYTARITINVRGRLLPVPRLRILPSRKIRTRQSVVLSGRGSFAHLGTSRIRNWQWDVELEDHHFHHYNGVVLGYRYGRPGRYRVRLTVTDTLGVKARASRTLLVGGRDYGPHNRGRPVVLSRT
jgi:hypothetical protein